MSGWIGAVVGVIVGGVAGLIAAGGLVLDLRALRGDERRETYAVFGDSLDLDAVRLGESRLLGAGGYARTPFTSIYFPPGAAAESDFVPWLIHELTHVWQTQHGVSVGRKLWWALHAVTGDPYDYGGEAGLIDARKAGCRFSAFNTEQQAEICRDYYRARRANLDTGAYDPYIAEVRSTVVRG